MRSRRRRSPAFPEPAVVRLSRSSPTPRINTLQISVPVTNADAIAVAPDNLQVHVANFNGESTRISMSSLTVIGSFASKQPAGDRDAADGRAYIGEIDDGIVSVVTLVHEQSRRPSPVSPSSAIAVGTINIPPS